MIKILTANNKDIHNAIVNLLRRVAKQLTDKSGKVMSDSMTTTVKEHISKKYPGSKYWDPNKVKNGSSSKSNGETIVDIESAGRAYHDVTIKPIRAKSLTIPIHSSAYGKKVSDFKDLFKPKDKNILAQNKGGHLVALFALAKSAFQKQDSSLMPTDESLANNIFNALAPVIEKSVSENINAI